MKEKSIARCSQSPPGPGVYVGSGFWHPSGSQATAPGEPRSKIYGIYAVGAHFRQVSACPHSYRGVSQAAIGTIWLAQLLACRDHLFAAPASSMTIPATITTGSSIARTADAL